MTHALLNTQSRNLIFLGHGIAGWVIQATLANYSGDEISSRTSGVIFIGLPQFKEDGILWTDLIQSFAELFTNNTNPLAGLEFHLLQSIEKDFSETMDYYKFVVGYVDLEDHYSTPPELVRNHPQK